MRVKVKELRSEEDENKIDNVDAECNAACENVLKKFNNTFIVFYINWSRFSIRFEAHWVIAVDLLKKL